MIAMDRLTFYFGIAAIALAAITFVVIVYVIISKASLIYRQKRIFRRHNVLGMKLEKLLDCKDCDREALLVPLLKKASLSDIVYLFDTIEFFPLNAQETIRSYFLHHPLHKVKNIALHSRFKERRIQAIKILGKSESQDCIDVLNQIVFSSHDQDIIYAVIQSLGEGRNILSVRSLIRLLGSGKLADSVISSVLDKLPTTYLEELLKCRNDSSYQVRFWLAMLLARYPSQAAGAILREMIKDGDPNVRAAVCESLGIIKDKEAVPLLHQMLKDSHWFVCLHAVKALGELLMPESIPELVPFLRSDNWWVRFNTRNVLKKYGQRVGPYLRSILNDADRFARNSAVEILEDIGYVEAMVKRFLMNMKDQDTGQFIKDFIVAEGLIWMESFLKNSNDATKKNLLNLIRDMDHDLARKLETSLQGANTK